MDESILGYPVRADSTDVCIRQITSWINSPVAGKYLVCANPHSLEVAQKDPCFQRAIRSADIVVPDGIGIIIASMILGGKIRERTTGMDIFLGLSAVLDSRKEYRYFFLGSTDENLVRIKDRMSRDFPHIIVAGTYSPPFQSEFSEQENQLMIDTINESHPDVLWVGMTAPKQEKWIYQNRSRLKVKFIGAIGAVFDFYTGTVKRSHPIFREMGFEWLPRFIRQPRRLWRRNFISGPRFLLRVITSRALGIRQK